MSNTEFTVPFAESFVQVRAVLDFPGYFVSEWLWETNTNITNFEIEFSADGNDLANSLCEVVAVEYSSDEVCQQFQPGGAEYIPAHALAVFNPDTGSVIGGELVETVDCYMPDGQTKNSENPCPPTAGLGCYGQGQFVKFHKETTFNYIINCDALGGEITTEQGTFCKYPMKDSFFKIYTYCTEVPIPWSSSNSSGPSLSYEYKAAAEKGKVPTSSAEAKSDPHFNGFRGQTYDVVGTPGKIYNLISDKDLVLNAAFGQAYTTGLYLDVDTNEVHAMAPKGTWISALGLKIGNFDQDIGNFEITTIVVHPRPTSVATKASKDVLKFGVVEVNGLGIDSFTDGSYVVNSYISLSIKNRSSYSRLSISAPKVSADFDAVLPPSEWEVADGVQYMHMNLKIYNIELSAQCHGLMGISNRETQNGSQVIEGSVEDYAVGSLLDSSFMYAVAQI